GRWLYQADRAVAERQHRTKALSHPIQALATLQAEDRAEDDLEREALQTRMQLDRLPTRPPRNLLLGDLGHQSDEALHLLPVEGGKHELALLHVGITVEQDDRVRPHDRLEHARPLPGVK